MKERPILFNGEMVRAILDGRKTQTRRVAKVTSDWCKEGFISPLAGHAPRSISEHAAYCPYGQPGDRLWVRERMRVTDVVDHGSKIVAIRVKYEADGAESDFIPYPDRLEGTPVVGKCLAYGGFCEASRITLEITGVRVERLQDISQRDVFAEGITNGDMKADESAHQAFRRLWDSINADRGFGWAVNPWVWVVEFRRIQK